MPSSDKVVKCCFTFVGILLIIFFSFVFIVMAVAQLCVAFLLWGYGSSPLLVTVLVVSCLFSTFFFLFFTLQTRKKITQSKSAELLAVGNFNAAVKVTNTDPMTGLCNRDYIKQQLDRALSHAVNHNETCALLYLGLDNFRDFNEALGHNLGNELLAGVGLRLKLCVKQSDLVGYFGGDEFIIILPKVSDIMFAEVVAKRVLSQLSEPYEIHGQQLEVSTSIGIALGPRHGARSEVLIGHAESALKECKSRGSKSYAFYSPAINEHASNRLSMDQRLRGALKRNEFSIVYQPIVAGDGRKLKGFEALIRWKSPELGHVSPSDFIPIAEQIGLISDIGTWVLTEACAQLQAWQKRYAKQLVMSVNVSPRQFHDGVVVSAVKSVIKKTGIQPKSIQLELTEGVMLNAHEGVLRDIYILHEMGVQLALDDFGTGYSSLSYINRMPFDVLKVDKSFVDGLCTNKRDHNMVKSVISLAHSMEIHVVIEGVETTEQLVELRALNADLIQGYCYSRPLLPKDAETRFLAGNGLLGFDEGVWDRL